MSPITIRQYRLKRGEREIGPTFEVKEITEHPLDKLVEKLLETLRKGKLELPIIPKGLMDDVEAPVYARLKQEFPDLVTGEGTYTQGRYPEDAALLIKGTMATTKEELCLVIYKKFASTDLEMNKPLRAQFLGVIVDEVGTFWPEENKK